MKPGLSTVSFACRSAASVASRGRFPLPQFHTALHSCPTAPATAARASGVEGGDRERERERERETSRHFKEGSTKLQYERYDSLSMTQRIPLVFGRSRPSTNIDNSYALELHCPSRFARHLAAVAWGNAQQRMSGNQVLRERAYCTT